MANVDSIVRVSDKLADPVTKLYKTGGFALAFGFLGFVTMLGASSFGGEYAGWLLMLGAILTFSCLCFFVLTTVRGHQKTRKAIRDSKETMDTIQDVSIELTRMVNTLQAYSFKNIDEINGIIQLATEQLQGLPWIGERADKYGITASKIAQTIVEQTEAIEEVIKNIEVALCNCDYEELQRYGAELEKLTAGLKERLSS